MALGPPLLKASDEDVRETTTVTREQHFPSAVDIVHLMRELRRRRATGKLCVDYNQGGIGSVRFSESQQLDLK